MNTEIKLREKRLWSGVHREIAFEVVNWSFFNKDEERALDWIDRSPTGNWNFYLYLHEKKCVDFKSLWLRDKIKRWSKGGAKYCSNDYSYTASRVARIDFHGGITYYEKMGHSKEFRCIKVGCDYAHLWDEGKEYDEKEVASDAVRAIDSAYDLGMFFVPEIVEVKKSEEKV